MQRVIQYDGFPTVERLLTTEGKLMIKTYWSYTVVSYKVNDNRVILTDMTTNVEIPKDSVKAWGEIQPQNYELFGIKE